MATHDDDETPSTSEPQMGMTDFARMIGSSVSAALAEQNPKKVTFGQYAKRVNAGRSVLARQTLQNGYLVEPTQLSNEEIDLLNQIDRTGHYIDRKVEVIVRDEGADEVVEIRFACKTADQRFVLARLFKNFSDMLWQIVTAQDEERQAEAAQADRKEKRQFGQSKATRAAVEAAAARG